MVRAMPSHCVVHSAPSRRGAWPTGQAAQDEPIRAAQRGHRRCGQPCGCRPGRVLPTTVCAPRLGNAPRSADSVDISPAVLWVRPAGGAGRRAVTGPVFCVLCSVFQHNMPFWRVSCHADLEALRHALELEYL